MNSSENKNLFPVLTGGTWGESIAMARREPNEVRERILEGVLEVKTVIYATGCIENGVTMIGGFGVKLTNEKTNS